MFDQDTQELTVQEYRLLRDHVYAQCGINLGDQKMQLVRARLGKRLRALGFTRFGQYYEHVKADQSGDELTRLLDLISTNTTHFYREHKHFDYLRERVAEWSRRPSPRCLRIWSAGCSSGEEPYTIAMVVDDVIRAQQGLQAKILATDLSTRVLHQATRGVYPIDRAANLPAALRQRYLNRVRGGEGEDCVAVSDALKRCVTFARFNLMTPTFPFRNPFDVIFCRNVMIYFDAATQAGLIHRFARCLAPGGILLIGHSESLHNLSQPLRYVAPTIYQKV